MHVGDGVPIMVGANQQSISPARCGPAGRSVAAASK